MIRGFVFQNNGSYQNASDVFQDAYVALYLKARKSKIVLDCDFGTYFYSFCKNIWLKELDRKKRHSEKIKMVHENGEVYGDHVEELIRAEEQLFYLENFNKLAQKCRELLKYYFNRVGFDEIAVALGFENANQARKRKHKCIKQLTQMIRGDARFIDMKGEADHE